MPSPAGVVLYKMKEGWNMPSLGAGSIAVEAYLRLAGIPFTVEVCQSERSSPTGQLPCIEYGDTLVGPPSPPVLSDSDTSTMPSDFWGFGGILGAASSTWTEMDAAAVCIRFLAKKITDVDVHLGQTARAQLTAFVSMVTSKVFPALLHATWVDNGAYSKHTSREYFQGLPFPLSWTQPRFTRRAIVTMLRHIPELTQDQLYAEATVGLEALESLCQGAEGQYLLGSRPTSLDAVVLGAVWFLRSFPGLPADLGDTIRNCPSLCAYVDRMAASVFAEAPAPAPADRHYNAEMPNRSKHIPTKAEVAHRRGNIIWGVGAAAVVVAYAALGGVLSIPISPEALEGLGAVMGEDGGEEEDFDDDLDVGDEGY